ncbi:phenylacetate--CoA ligase family protein [Mycetocola zhadangensis]|uniref:phenylacetate--CoA ligase family protein n=1 Tax=Mycetocola zhadangensis TaxID=1164595 RepID=UPI003A4D8506
MSARRALFDLKVRLAGGRPYAEFLASSGAAENSTPHELLAFQARQADHLVRYAAESTAWYRDRIGSFLQRDLTDPAVFEQIPILEKEDLRDHYDDLLARNSRATRTAIARTGGSTGVPLKVLKDFSVRPATLTWRLLGWWGVDPSDNSASIERLPWHGWRSAANRAFWWPTRKINVDAGVMTPERMAEFARAVQRIKPRVISGYAASLHEYALAVEKNGWQIPAPQALSTTAAPLTRVQTADIERIFGAPTYDAYRAAELSLIAGQCEHRQGMHIMADHKLLEVVDAAGRRVPDGQPGEIVVTDLMNHAQPLIRYRLGDVGVIDTEPCRCGRPFPVLKSLLGRSNDVLRTPKGSVSAYSFASIFSNNPAIRQYQIHQQSDYSLILRVVPSSTSVTVNHLETALAALAHEFNGDLPVRAEIVSEIVHIRGKQKSIVSEAPAPDAPDPTPT